MENNPRGFDDLKEIDSAFLEQAKVSWLTKILLGISLSWGLARLARELSLPGIETSKKAHALFQKVARVDFVPSRSTMRGFQIILDGLLSLYFSQEGDHFVYDGFEMGPYDEGDVTVLDKLR
jgi:uncharacterized membrane protein (UPF0136 family)